MWERETRMILLVTGLLIVVMALVITQGQRLARTRRTPSAPPGFQRTDEVVIDPTTNVRQRVWYNPRTGERIYRREDGAGEAAEWRE